LLFLQALKIREQREVFLRKALAEMKIPTSEWGRLFVTLHRELKAMKPEILKKARILSGTGDDVIGRLNLITERIAESEKRKQSKSS
jgi:hypothetical protein